MDQLVATDTAMGLPETEYRPTTQIKHSEMQEHIAKALAEHRAKGTGQLDKNRLNAIPNLTSAPYGIGIDAAVGFIPMPMKAEQRRSETWLIELQGLGREAIGIHLLGDVVLGMTRPNCAGPDLDLSMFDAETKGVSRRHAVLRPSRNRLFVIDLQSTNGTQVNMMPVNPGIAKEVHNRDTISLGALTFTIKIIATPEQLEALRSGQTA